MLIRQSAFIATFITAFITSLAISAQAVAQSNGELRRLDAAADYEAYDLATAAWGTPEAFWIGYAESKGGLTWGQGTVYPPYKEVKEFDTFMVEVDEGICLMEFFHSRWRRANDVRRWHPDFNMVGGCPWVFD